MVIHGVGYCGNSPVRTLANVPVSPEEGREIAAIFDGSIAFHSQHRHDSVMLVSISPEPVD